MVERLISFLFSNWYLLVIVYAIYTSLRKKIASGPPEQQQEDSPDSEPDMPRFEGEEHSTSKLRSAVREQQESAPKAPAPVSPLRAERSSARITAPPVKPVVKRRAASASIPTATSHEVIKGMIWSEIMGPPRSKKSRGYYRK